jgi:hypothetical protein
MFSESIAGCCDGKVVQKKTQTNDLATLYLNVLERVNETVKNNSQFSIQKTRFL